MTIAVDLGRKAIKQTNKNQYDLSVTGQGQIYIKSVLLVIQYIITRLSMFTLFIQFMCNKKNARKYMFI